MPAKKIIIDADIELENNMMPLRPQIEYFKDLHFSTDDQYKKDFVMTVDYQQYLLLRIRIDEIMTIWRENKSKMPVYCGVCGKKGKRLYCKKCC